jgi:hypothetical protein
MEWVVGGALLVVGYLIGAPIATAIIARVTKK